MGEVYDTCAGFDAVIYYVVYAIRILRIVVPIILILWASIDLVRSIISGDEKKISAMRKPIIQRFLSAVLVFLLPWIVSLLIGSVSKSGDADWKTCFRAAWTGKKDNTIFDIKKWD